MREVLIQMPSLDHDIIITSVHTTDSSTQLGQLLQGLSVHAFMCNYLYSQILKDQLGFLHTTHPLHEPLVLVKLILL